MGSKFWYKCKGKIGKRNKEIQAKKCCKMAGK